MPKPVPPGPYMPKDQVQFAQGARRSANAGGSMRSIPVLLVRGFDQKKNILNNGKSR